MQKSPPAQIVEYAFRTVITGKVNQVRSFFAQEALSYDVRDNAGATALHHIAAAPDYHAHDKQRNEILALFLNKGVDINTPDNAGATPLHYLAKCAINYGDREKLSDLISFGGDPNAKDKEKKTPLHWAVSRNNFHEIIKHFIDKGAKVNALDEVGQTPLHLAAAAGEKNSVKILLDCGADANAKTHSGKFPYEYAAEGGHEYLAQTLKAHAAMQRAKQQARLKAEMPTDPWVLLSPDKVAFSSREGSIGYRITEVFNFGARTYTQIAQNLHTNVEGVTVRLFDEFADASLLEKAHDELQRLGGIADRDLIRAAKHVKTRKRLG